MKEVTPDYYSQFECIAGKCKHNCCIGWEIDIDEKALNFYRNLESPLGKRIMNNIEGDEPHFILDENERCPFLNCDNLCEIISECGKEALCDICRLHPRFRNFYTGFVETGLGLCCEEAARIILSLRNKFCIHIPDGVETNGCEKVFFEIRSKIFNILQNRDLKISKRFDCLSQMFGLKFDFSIKRLCEVYLSLERLDEEWTRELENLANYEFNSAIFDDDRFSLPLEQLSVYFIFRHLAGALEYGDYSERVMLAAAGCYVIAALWKYHKDELTDEKMIDIVRMYSSEIEYSEENIDLLLFSLKNTII